MFFFFFYKFKLVTTLHQERSFISSIFPTAFAHLVSLCHILVVLALFQAFSLLLCLLQ